MDETFKFVLSCVNDASLQVQVRASQATKDLATHLLNKSNPDKSNVKKVKQLLQAILTFAKSDRLKTAANALRALGFFLAEADLVLVFDTSDQSDEARQIRQIVQNQLAHKSPKVSWNACIVIAKTIKNESLARC